MNRLSPWAAIYILKPVICIKPTGKS
ncbi:hypothetical protein EMIT0P260_90084 [Pseudomonas sp. IT-P260]